MKPYAKKFYNSTQWIATRNAYFKYRYGLCERCIKPAEIIHHKTYINPSNINDTSITLDWNNLEALCRECHAKEHEGQPSINEGLIFNEDGDIEYEIKDIL